MIKHFASAAPGLCFKTQLDLNFHNALMMSKYDVFNCAIVVCIDERNLIIKCWSCVSVLCFSQCSLLSSRRVRLAVEAMQGETSPIQDPPTRIETPIKEKERREKSRGRRTSQKEFTEIW